MSGRSVNEWFAIAGTAHAGSPAAPTDSPLDIYSNSNLRLAFSGMGLRDSEVILAACGGHGDYAGNEVTSIDLATDAPTWRLRSSKSAASNVMANVAYYGDGKPSSRHTYWSTHYSTTRNRLILHRSRFVYGSAVSFNASNGFNLNTNTWDATGTWRDGYTAGCRDAYDNVWALTNYSQTLMKWTASTDSWSVAGNFNSSGPGYPLAHDSTRNQLFGLSWGDGEGSGTGLKAAKYTSNGSVRTAVTFNASAALSALQASQPMYAAMEYDPLNDRFYFYAGGAGQEGRIYVIAPNAGSVWDVSILALRAGSAIPPTAPDSGLCSRFRYVAALRGCVLMVNGTSALYFIRTS
jgi:hypothetical protein